MKINNKLVFIFFIMHSAFSWGYSCPANQYFTKHHTQNMYSNSVLWLQQHTGTNIGTVIAKSKTDTVPFNLKTTTLNNEIKLIPKKPYLKNTEYTLVNKHLEQQYSTEDLTFKISDHPPVDQPRLETAPTLEKYQYHQGDMQTGPSGEIQFKFKANLDPADYLVRLKVSQSNDFSAASEYILEPFQTQKTDHLSDKSDAVLTHVHSYFGACHWGVRFQENDHFWIKMDLISHQGDLISSPFPASEIIIAPEPKAVASKPVDDIHTANFWQKLLIKIKSFFISLFSFLG